MKPFLYYVLGLFIRTQALGNGGYILAVTGATGELGRALIRCAQVEENGYAPDAIGICCRDWSNQWSLPLSSSRCFHVPVGDLADVTSVSATTRLLCSAAVANSASRFVLINGAGVCLAGLSSAVLAQSIAVNALYPILLAQSLGCHLHPSISLQVINVSSGDGQSCYLDSDLAAAVASLASVSTWERFCVDFPATWTQSSGHRELAHSPGNTPAYSVSKALLTKGSVLLQQAWQAGSANAAAWHRQSLSLCPGDFASPMTTPEAVPHLRPVTAAAGDVWDMVINSRNYQGGGFYYLRREQAP